MFHNTHAYLASKIYQSEDTLLIIGSILPDIAVTKVIKWEGGLHGFDRCKDFEKFIQGYEPDYMNLYKGIYAHNIVDDITHKNYIGGVGYAYQNNHELVGLVKRLYGLDEDRAKGVAHNYIESAVDILLLEKYPKVQQLLRNAANSIDKEYIAELLSEYFRLNKEDLEINLNKFLDLFTKYDFKDQISWVRFWEDLEKLLSLKSLTSEQRGEILITALNSVKLTYEDFLSYTIIKGHKLLNP
ncbi:hypothetical protein HYS93_00195 [Candidatus Daviesbacteria bacterium]|nr:hypothetical protein [Candidatus Daviesbacteria bacterium]